MSFMRQQERSCLKRRIFSSVILEKLNYRGDVGSRIDETGPYLPASPHSDTNASESPDVELKKSRVFLGPEKPHSLRYSESSDDESHQDKKKKTKAESSKRHSKKYKRERKYKSIDKSRDKKKKRMEKNRKHHK